jgi:voltage-gated sodium channel
VRARRLPSTDDREALGSPSRIVRTCARLADSTAFNSAIFVVIVANAVVLGLETYPSIERAQSDLLHLLNDVFLGIFVVELVIRLVGFGRRPQDFFRSGWNVFDFVVVVAAFTPGIRENATLLRLIRLARIVRIVRLLPDLRVLVLAVGRSVPAVASLFVMGLVVVYLYGMVGWVLFDDGMPDEFGTVGDAMLTMFVALTGENLPDLLARGPEVSSWAVPFFLSYAIAGGLLLLNILIGIVINSMEEARAIEDARERGERAEHGEGAHAGPMPDPAARIAQLRRALDDLERDLQPR